MLRITNLSRRRAAIVSGFCLAAGFGVSALPASSTSGHHVTSVVTTRPQAVHLETKPFIDGADTPGLIPDQVAYSLFLRMLLPGQTADARVRQQAYIRHILRGAAALSRGSAAGEASPRDEDSSRMLRLIELRLKTFFRWCSLGNYYPSDTAECLFVEVP